LRTLSLLLSALSTCALVAEEPKLPTVKWRGSFWASAATSNQEAVNGSLFLRPVDSTRGGLSLDGLTLGADMDLGKGWSFRTTLLGGRLGELVNLTNGQTGTLALPEAMLVWTGEKDVVRIGRMNTFLGMEFTDGTQDLAASRGLLFNFAVPFTQVGLNWHHSFTTSWSSDLWVFNGEDRISDNNRGKTVGVGLNYNHGGASDKFVSFGAYRGPEQQGFGEEALPGAEGRNRERLFANGQWVWGAFTLQWEAEHAREAMPAGVVGAEAATATWRGFGLIGRFQVAPGWAVFGRAEQLKDDTGMRLAGDPSVAGLLEAGTLGTQGLDLTATAFCAGVERAWDKTFTRLELRTDRLNKDVQGKDGAFRSAMSLTWSVGTSF